MKPRISLSVVLLFVLLCVIPGQAQGPEVQGRLGTGITYQGQLRQGGSLYSGTCDFQFSLWDATSGGSQVGSTLTRGAVAVSRGLFSMLLDFGSRAFEGESRWLGIKVRCPAGTGVYITLSPRQAISATPYALYALAAPSAGVPTGVIVMWSGSLDTIPAGWALCDGTNGTPDLRDRFVVGAAAGQNPGQTGGASSHSHTVGAHTHEVNPPYKTTTAGGAYTGATVEDYVTAEMVSDCLQGGTCDLVAARVHTHAINIPSHTHTVDIPAFTSGSATSATNTVSNRPPYYTVAYIMKQ